MPRALLAALAAAVFAMTAFVVPAQALEMKNFDYAEFQAAQAAGKPVLIDVYAPWCPTCKAQQEAFEELKNKPEFAGVTIMKVDFDNQVKALKQFNAQRQSTLIAFKGDKETGRTVGETAVPAIAALISSTLK